MNSDDEAERKATWRKQQDAYEAGTKKTQDYFGFLDFTKIGNRPKEARTLVRINASDCSRDWGGSDDVSWMMLAASSLTYFERQNLWLFRADLGDKFVDVEHDRGVLVSMSLVGVSLTSVRGNCVEVVGWVDTMQGDDFKVPSASYDPTKDPETEPCTYKGCKEESKHFIIPNYICKPNPTLLKKVGGRKVTILFRPYAKELDGE